MGEIQISEKAKQSILGNNKLIGKLMIAFDRTQKSIENWVNKDDLMLTTPKAVEIISEHTGLTEDQILVSEPAKA